MSLPATLMRSLFCHVALVGVGFFGFSQDATMQPHYFNMTIYVFEGIKDEAQTLEKNMPEIVQMSLEKLGPLMGYRGYRSIDAIAWLVRADGNMDRFLDIPEKWWALAEGTNISFKLIYNFQEKYLTLHDFRFMINQIPKLHTSVGLPHEGAAILGHSKIESRDNDIFFIVTLEVQDEPFPKQSSEARFTVIGLTHDHH